jgi:hypothetical protein
VTNHDEDERSGGLDVQLAGELIERAITDLGFVRSGQAPAAAAGVAHWRRSGFATWVFQPAATGWYPKKAPQPARPVPVIADPFPGVPVRGRGAQSRANWCWTPIAQGLTPHGLRHSHKTAMVELRTPEILSHERLGHRLDGIGARYSHVTPAMRSALREELTDRWEAALKARAALHPRSPVGVLDELIQGLARKTAVGRSEDRPTEFPQEDVSVLRARPRKRAWPASGWRDLNPRPLRPERSALPSCATPR